MNFLNIIIAIYIITQFKTESNAQSINSESLEDNIIERVQIDLKSKIQASGKENDLEISVYNNSINLSRYDIKMSRFHSNQLNEKSINSFFKIANKTNILFLNDGSNRAKLNIKSCDKQFYAQNDKCVFSLNLILYLLTSNKQSNIEKLVHFNEIKVVKLSIILSDFSDDFLVFERKLYEYNVYLNESSNNSSSFISIGQINAKSAKNSDFNHLIKYYLGYKNDDVSFGSLFRVNEQSGDLSLNKTAISTKEGSKYKFYVDALMQPSAAQKVLKTRAIIQVNLIKDNQDKPRIKITNLIDTKQLYPSVECIKFTKNDFNLIGQLKKDSQNQSSIALAQIQIETSTINDDADYFSNEYSLAIESIKPDYLNRSSIQIKIKHLIDNIYVVYLIVTDKSVQYKQLFLTDLYQIKLVLINGNYKVRNNIYLCVNIPNEETTTTILEKSSLVQFSQNIYSLYLTRSNYIDLYAYDLAEFHQSNLSIFIDSKSTQVFETQITAVESNSSLTKFRLNVTNLGSSGQIEQLQYEVIGVAFNSDKNSNPVETYKTLSKIGQNENKFLSFACKVLINTELETSINDSSSFVYSSANEIRPVYKFYTKVDDLLNNSIIGHLPNVYDLKLDNFLTFDSNTIQSYSYRLVYLNEKLNNCFRLNKYDGVLHFIESDNSSQLNCYLKENYPVRLDVVLESENQLLNYAQIWIYDVSSKIQNEMINYKNYYEINSNSINLVYDSASSKINNDSSRNEFNLNYKLNFDPKSANASLPTHLRLVSLVSNFKPSLEQKENVVKKNPSVSFNQIDYRTKFEFFGQQLDDLFMLDSKKSSIYLNLTQLGTNLIIDNCMSLRLISKNYIYINSIHRELISFDRFNLNLCFVNDEKRENNFIYLNNLNITYRSLITPILNSDLSSYDYLVKNYTHKNNFFFNSLVWFILLVVVLLFSIFLILTTIYVCSTRSKVERKSNSSSDSESFKNQIYKTDTFSSLEDSNEGSIHLKIRNDLSKNADAYDSRQNFINQFGYNVEHECKLKSKNFVSLENLSYHQMNQIMPISTRYHLNSSFRNECNKFDYIKQDARVPSCRLEQIFKDLNEYEVSSIKIEKESSEDQGVYCLATGTSFSLSSNISSVTNSQFVDDMYQFEQSCSSSSSSSSSSNNGYLINEKTRLSLFDLTPNVKGKKIEKQMQIKKSEINDDMKKWIFQNYNINCNFNLQAREDQNISSNSSNLIQIESNNEFII